jgi:hypothetical protein
MASDIPVRDLRPLADWRDELGLDRLRADLIDGGLDACWYDHATGDYHPIPRVHWREKKAVEHALGWGWPLGDMFSSDTRLCTIYAWRPVPPATPAVDINTPPDHDHDQRRTPLGWAQRDAAERLRAKWAPDGVPPEEMSIGKICEAIGLDPESKRKTVSRAVRRLKEAKLKEAQRPKR